MKRSVIVLILMAMAGSAAAQTTVTTHNQAAAAGAAGVAARMQALGYSGIHDLRRGPDGQWTGKAVQNGVEKNVTVSPDGTAIGR